MACLFAFPVQAGELELVAPGRVLVVEVARAEAVYRERRAWVEFFLTDADSDAMGALTERMIGEDLVVRLCGRDVIRAMVRSRIAGHGIFPLAPNPAAVAAADVLNGNGDCATLEDKLAE